MSPRRPPRDADDAPRRATPPPATRPRKDDPAPVQAWEPALSIDPEDPDGEEDDGGWGHAGGRGDAPPSERGLAAYRRKIEEERGGDAAGEEAGAGRAKSPRPLPAPVPAGSRSAVRAVVPAAAGARGLSARGAAAGQDAAWTVRAGGDRRAGGFGAPASQAAASSSTSPAPAPAWWRRHPDVAASAALLVLGFFLVVTTYGDLGWSWDEAFYLPPARLAQQWVGGALGGGFPDGGALSRQVMERHWGPTQVVGNQEFINELPALTKWSWALGLTLFEGSLGTMRAMRLPTALFFALTLVVVYHLCRLVTPPLSALFAAACFAAMPRVFGHAHVAATEMPMALLAAATTYAFARGLSSRRWAIAAGVLFGLALATKVNAFFLFPGLFLWAWLFHRDRLGHPVAAMIFLAPVVFVAAWPWLWHDTVARILEYLAYHAHNESRGLLYGGTTYGGAAWNGAEFVPRPQAPWTYPFVMLAVTTPPAVLAFLVVGIARVVVARSCAVGWLLLLQAAVPILVIAAPGQPKYDGVRLFLPAYPFLAALCGFGLGGLLRQFSPDPSAPGRDPLKEIALRRVWWMIAAAAWIVLAVSGVRALASAHPLHLTYFNRFVGGRGGIQGAWDAGYEVTYWNEGINREALAWLNDHLPPGAHVKTRALHVQALRDYQAWGWLRRDLRFDELPAEGGATPRYDIHLVATRRGFWGEFDWMMYARFADRARHVVRFQGVPLLFVWGPLEELGIGERRIEARLGKDPDASPPPEW